MQIKTLARWRPARVALSAFVIALVLATTATAQGRRMPARGILFKNVTLIADDGSLQSGVDVLVQGSKIKEVGEGLEAPTGVRTVAGEGRFLVPSFVDASSELGLASATKSRSAEGSVVDAIDPWARERFAEAAAGGISHLYLRNGVANGNVGGRGFAMKLGGNARAGVESSIAKGSETLHLAFGMGGAGPLARIAELDRFKKALEAARKYEESWEKYREELKKYEEGLKSGKTADLGDAKKASGTPTRGRPTPGARPTRRPRPRRSPTEPDVEHFCYGRCPICVNDDDDHEDEDEDHIHILPPPFSFDEFAPLPLGEQAKKKTPEKKSGDKKPASKGSVKKPKEPRFNAATEQIVRALNGEIRVRLEVHRAEDVLHILGLLETFPMRVAFEGCTEGYRVAEQIAEAGIPVVLNGQPLKPAGAPAGGATGGRNLPFPFPRGRFPRNFPLRGGGGAASTQRGEPSAANAAKLADAGVKVVIASSGLPADATPQLLSAAAWAAGQGMKPHQALQAITSNAALVLGQEDRLGRIAPGKSASLALFSGHPLSAASTVDAVYADGNRIYRK